MEKGLLLVPERSDDPQPRCPRAALQFSERGGHQLPASDPHGLERALLAAIVENSDDAIASKDLTGVVTTWNRAAERLFGYRAEEIVGHNIAVLAAPGRENEIPMILERIRRGERVDHYDTVRRRKDGSLVEISLTVSPVRDRHGRIVGASKIAHDISGRRRQEKERELRVGELRHRVKNLLAIVGAIASQTAVHSPSVPDYRDDFMGRLSALATAHEAAFQSEDGCDLEALITRLLDPYVHGAWSELVTVEPGPVVRLPKERVQAFASSCTSLPPMRSSTVRSRIRKVGCDLRGAQRVRPMDATCTWTGRSREAARLTRLHRRGLA